jgi:hypothetical protein
METPSPVLLEFWNMFLTKHGLQSCSGTPGGGTCDVGTIELENR